MEFIVAIGAAIVLTWLAAAMFRGGPIGTALLVLLAGICFGHAFYNLPLGPMPLTADRVLLAALVVQYLLWRRWGWLDGKPLGAADYLLLALVAVLGLSTLVHDYQSGGGRPLAQLLFFYVMPATLYWVVRQSEFSERASGWLLGSLTVFGIYVAITAIAETHQAWQFVFPKYIASGDYREFFGRARGPLLNPAGNGVLLGLSTCAALVWWQRLNLAGRLLVVAALPLYAWGVYETMTRSAWMGAALGALVVVALVLPVRWRIGLLGGAAAAGLLVATLGWDNLMAFKRDRDVSPAEVAESVKLRPILATVAWHMFLDRPLLGCGFGQYVQESPAYLSDRSTDLPLEKARPFIQHNVFLSLLTETGLVGVSLFVALLAAWTRSAWRLWSDATALPWVRQMGLVFLGFLAVYLTNGMFHDVSLMPMINMILFFLGGAVTGLGSQVAEAKSAARLRLWLPEGELVAAH